ncbi:MAG: tripartite tricarboxylate transporter TctB family protein [Bacillaceae bacterium]|nr:tripartite tricarboxylate transporter TctB family protein [Bacillaceae bacterium]
MLRSVNQKISIILLLVAVFYLIFSYQLPSYPYIPVDADFIPKVLGWLLVILAIALFFAKDQDSEEQKAKRRIPKKDALVILGVFGMVFIYILLLEIIGFVMMTALFIYFSSWFLGYTKHVTNVIVSILFPVILYGIFNYLLQINLPSGILPL